MTTSSLDRGARARAPRSSSPEDASFSGRARARRPVAAAGACCAAFALAVAPVAAAPTPEELDRSVTPLIAPVESLSGGSTVRPLARAAGGGRTIVPSDVLFAFGRAEVRADGRRALARLAASLARRPGALRVVGHTDGVGGAGVNRRLSRRRAAAVVAVLRPGLPAAVRLAASGRGAADPVADERTPDGRDDPDGRARNRRVELRFVAR